MRSLTISTLKKWFFWLLGIREKPSKKINKVGKVVVVIPAYNEVAHIQRTIQSLQTQTMPPDRILVVDDCSSDGTGEVARKCGAEVVRTPHNSGTKSQAQNYALQLIDPNEYPVLITVDADTVLAPDALEKILPYLSDSQVASACGFVVPQRIKTIWERARFIEYLITITIHKGAQNHCGAPMVSSGCFSAFNTKLLKEFGGFPDRTMAEDMDLTWCFLRKGKKIVLAPEAVCYPLDPHSFKCLLAQTRRWRRAFLQNITVHGRGLWEKKSLFFFVFGYLCEALLSPLYYMGLSFLVFRAISSSTSALVLLPYCLLTFGLVTILAIVKGWQLKKPGLALTSIPCYFLLEFVYFYVFWESVWLEWIRKKRLKNWEKGHPKEVSDGVCT